MIPLISIYRFNTPFFDAENERVFFLNFAKNIQNFVENQGIEYKKNVLKSNENSQINFLLGDFGEINICFVNKINLVLPILEIDILFTDNFIKNNGNIIYDFILSFLELFDGKNEFDFCIDYNTTYLKYKDFDNGLITINDVKKRLSKSDFKKEVDKIIEANTDYDKSKINNIYTYFAYIILTIYKNISKIKDSKIELEKITYDDNNIGYKGTVELTSIRLDKIQEINTQTFTIYYDSLEKLYNYLKK